MGPQVEPDAISRPKGDAWNNTCDNALGLSCYVKPQMGF